MARVHALPVIRQHFDDAAFGQAAVAAFLDHHRKLRFERLQAGDALLDLGQTRAGDCVRRGAGLGWIIL